ncbi:MAG: 1-acyl-sn-glycerol-3-phosphate acyltransferase [Deltaproteobacteria bacterium]|nr:1-acyl-sn-glycerol-3-phosphate acyltransferase [Deltaproteobacteria bacterium]MBW2661093.1 1-acyl-sn-glycerol-3-phosphate acyltransferase [Deltaproteobacteria bacterium]
MIRAPFVIIWVVLVTIYFSIAAIIVSFIKEGCILPNKVAKAWARCVLFGSRIKVTVTGLSNIDPFLPYIYMSNHQSAFDIPVLQAHLPVQFRWLAKAELFKIPVFGYAIGRAGHISIDRSNRKSAFKSLKNASKNIRNGVSVIIFPEGTRSLDGNIRQFKKGGFVLAVDAGVPIVPVIIHGIWPIMLRNKALVKPGNIIVEIKNPIKTIDYTRKTKDHLMEKVRKVISESFEEGKKDKMLC